MLSFDAEIFQSLIAAAIGIGGTYFGLRKKLSTHDLGLQQDKAQVDVINYLKETRQIALDSEEAIRKKYDALEEVHNKMSDSLKQLRNDNRHLRSQNQILNDIIKSLNESLSKTKDILEEQILVNNQLLIKISSSENHGTVVDI